MKLGRFGRAETSTGEMPGLLPEGFGLAGEPLLHRPLAGFGASHTGPHTEPSGESIIQRGSGLPSVSLLQFGAGEGPGLSEAAGGAGVPTSGLPAIDNSDLADRSAQVGSGLPTVALLQFGAGEGPGLSELAEAESNSIKHAADHAFGFPTFALERFGEGGGPGLPPIDDSGLSDGSLHVGFGLPTVALLQFGAGDGPGLSELNSKPEVPAASFISSTSVVSGAAVGLQPFGKAVSAVSGTPLVFLQPMAADHISKRPLHAWWIALVLGLVLLVPAVALCLARSGLNCTGRCTRRRLPKRSAASAAAPGMDPPLMQSASPKFPQPPAPTAIEP